MRVPSDKLMQLLTELQLCTAQDVAACESRVRSLSHDLPEFDFVWIDALVQQRTLTPWQADILQSPDPHSLRIDEYLKYDQPGANTYLAVSTKSGRHVVLQRQATQESRGEQHRARLQSELDHVSNVRASAPAALELPRCVVRSSGDRDDNAEILVASSFVPGWAADELLIRGGRLPWPAVSEIARQLLSGASWLENQQLVHGEISLHNVRLRPDGRSVLVSPLMNVTARQGISLTANLRLKDVATVAPERLGTGAQADSRSELYSVGCVLWQLLTARPPFLSADPVNKVSMSQEQDVADVRTLVPDCPDWMARLLQSFTRRSPELRPESLQEASEKWKQHAATGRQQTRRLLKRMRKPPLLFGPHRRAAPRGRLVPFVTATLMIAAFAAYGFHRGLLPGPLTLRGPAKADAVGAQLEFSSDVIDADPQSDASVVDANGWLKMPRPDAAGVVVLQSGQTYAAADLEFSGVMHIETTGSAGAVVKTTTQQPWRLMATQIVLSNVQVQMEETSETPNAAGATAVECECDVLSMKGCIIDSGNGTSRDRGLWWKPRTGVTSVVSVSDCVLMGSGYGLWMSRPPARCTLKHLLVTNRRGAVRCDVNSSDSIRLVASHLTQVGGVSFLDAVLPDSTLPELRIQVECGESVFAVRTGLVQIAAAGNWPLSRAQVEFLLPERGNPSIVLPDVQTAIAFDSTLNAVVGLAETQMRTEALLIANPVFREEADGRMEDNSFAAFELLDYEGPKLSQEMPGVEVDRLPIPVQRP